VYNNGMGQVLITMGAMLVLQELVKVPFGQNSVAANAPTYLTHSWIVGHVVIVEYQLVLILLGIMVYLLLHWLLKHTRLGLTIRAGIHNPELVQARGIQIRLVFTCVVVLGAALAGLAGALSSPYFGAITPDIGINMQLDAFIIVVVGGLGSLNGSFIGSLLIGMVTAFVSYYFPSLAVLVDVMVMAVVLFIRPHGLFGDREAV
jgi:branched-chain amino acid transport system permease protein